ncbi:MAG: hypothetical protein JRJ85_25750 [Deltaproteobacteria bacterium]|nr:hypothetical protein [Deltaproteobacteria bacterium]
MQRAIDVCDVKDQGHYDQNVKAKLSETFELLIIVPALFPSGRFLLDPRGSFA